jgi:hypothetical protein
MKQIIFLLMMTLAALTNFAQNDKFIKGTEKPIYSEAKDSTDCLVYGKFLIKTNVIQENGRDIYKLQSFARNSSLTPQQNCQPAGDPIVSFERKEEMSFIEPSLLGNLLFANLNITPDSQTLLIFDLSTGKKIFEAEHSEWGKAMKLNNQQYLIFSKWTKKKGLAKNCPNGKKWEKQGLSVDWTQPYRLDLKTMKTTLFGPSQCVSTY